MSISFNVDFHKSPSGMILSGSVDDNGNGSITFNRNGKSYNHTLQILASSGGATATQVALFERSGTILEKGGRTAEGTKTFTVPVSGDVKLYFMCYSNSAMTTHDCANTAACSFPGELFASGSLHTHSAPIDVTISNSNKLNNNNGISASTTSISASISVGSFGCITTGSTALSINDSRVVSGSSATWDSLTPGTEYTIRGNAENSHSSSDNVLRTEASAVTIRTRYATPTVSAENGNKLNGNNASVSNSTSSITIDASGTKTTNCGTVTYYYSKDGGANYTKSSSNSHTFNGLTAGTTYNISVYATNGDGDKSSGVSFSIRTRYAKPTVTLSNANVRSGTNNAAVSNSTNSIEIKATVSGSNIGPSFTYYFKKSIDSDASWVNNGNNDTYTFTGLNPGTSYTLQVLVDTADGYSSDTRSDLKSITIRTCYAKSNFTNSITVNDIGLEHVVFTPSFKYGSANIVKSATYSITGGVSGDGCSGTGISIQSNQTTKATSSYCLTASSKYKITVSITTTDTYDRITFDHAVEFTTDAKSSFSKTLGNLGFAMPSVDVFGTYTIKNPSGNKVRCTLYVKNTDSSSYTTICTRDLSSGWDKQQDLILTDNECDKIYKVLANTTNVMNYLWRVGTYSNRYNNYTKYYTDCTGSLTLNGKMKTLHIGSGNHRAAVFVGVKNGNTTAVKRAVIWYGDSNGKPHRCI